MKTYFRITAYHKEKDFSVILDTYQMFEQLWEFSALLIEKGFDIIEVGRTEKFDCRISIFWYGIWFIEADVKYF